MLALLLLVSALIVPRAAWDAHEAGHESLSSANAVHTHHDGYAHEHDGAQTDDGQGIDSGESDSGLTHEHGPSFAQASAIVLPNADTLPILRLSKYVYVERASGSAPLHHPDSLLRPPRTA